jgi:murein L,D-transpeptidase YcbB/YkuD
MPKLLRTGVTAFLLATAAGSVVAAENQANPTAIDLALNADALPGLTASAAELGELRLLYADRAFEPIWWGDAEAHERRRTALDVLARSDEQGLQANYYSSASTSPLEEPQAGQVDIQLTLAVLRYARDVQGGRLLPNSVYRDVDLTQISFEPAAALASALRSDDLAGFLSALPPPRPEYQHLVAALARYRRIEAHGGWPSIPGDKEVKTDGSDRRLDVLMQRLGTEDPDAAVPGADPVAALKRYQQRNGLTADGRAGALTLEMLNVAASERVAQIVANLERWRWLPRTFESRYVAVNVPDQQLTLVENGGVVLASRVIVGQSRTPTPIFRATATAVTVNPVWNVPLSIATKEILPRLKREPGYLAAQDMVVLNGPADDPSGTHIDWRRVSADRFPYQIQQLPGDKNALGKIKLELPNRFSVYLHDTPGRALFQRDQRALSHGCIRVQEILPLAVLAMGGDAGAQTANVNASIAEGGTAQFSLSEPLPVYVLYWTAIAAEDGSVGFRRDLYGRDRRLIAAMRDTANTRSVP